MADTLYALTLTASGSLLADVNGRTLFLTVQQTADFCVRVNRGARELFNAIGLDPVQAGSQEHRDLQEAGNTVTLEDIVHLNRTGNPDRFPEATGELDELAQNPALYALTCLEVSVLGRPVTLTQMASDDARRALRAIGEAFEAYQRAWHRVQDLNPADPEFQSDGYPFEASLDDLVPDVREWVTRHAS